MYLQVQMQWKDYVFIITERSLNLALISQVPYLQNAHGLEQAHSKLHTQLLGLLALFF